MQNTTPVARSVDPSLAPEIKAHMERVKGHCRDACKEAIAAGKKLRRAKKLVPKGNWEAWVKQNIHVSLRTAQVYMKLARGGDNIEAQHAAPGSIRKALEALVLPKPVNEDKADAKASPENHRDSPPQSNVNEKSAAEADTASEQYDDNTRKATKTKKEVSQPAAPVAEESVVRSADAATRQVSGDNKASAVIADAGAAVEKDRMPNAAPPEELNESERGYWTSRQDIAFEMAIRQATQLVECVASRNEEFSKRVAQLFLRQLARDLEARAEAWPNVVVGAK